LSQITGLSKLGSNVLAITLSCRTSSIRSGGVLLLVKTLLKELALVFICTFSVFLFDAVHFSFELCCLFFQFEHGFIFVLDQSRQVSDSFILLLILSLELVLLKTVTLQLHAHFYQALTLLIFVLVLKSLKQLLVRVSTCSCSVELVSDCSVLRAHSEVFLFKECLIIVDVLNDAIKFLRLCCTDVGALAL